MPRGRHLEALIRKAATQLADLGIARIYQWPVQQIAQETTVKCPNCNSAHSGWKPMYPRKTGFDFFGYSRHGRFIAIEAKECSTRRLPVNVQQGHGVKGHQVTALKEVARNGGAAFVIWGRGLSIRLIPIGDIDESAKSISWDGDEFNIDGLAARLAIAITLLAGGQAKSLSRSDQPST